MFALLAAIYPRVKAVRRKKESFISQPSFAEAQQRLVTSILTFLLPPLPPPIPFLLSGNEAIKVELAPSPGLDRAITFQLENENLGISDIANANQLYNIIGLVRIFSPPL